MIRSANHTTDSGCETIHVWRRRWWEIAACVTLMPVLIGGLAVFSDRAIWPLAILGGAAVIAQLDVARRYRGIRLENDEYGMAVYGLGDEVVVRWADVRAVSLPKKELRPTLRLELEDRSVAFPVRFFDVIRVVEMLRRRLPADVFAEDARANIPRIGRERHEMRVAVEGRLEPVRVGTWMHPFTGAAALGFALAGLFCSFGREAYLAPFFFAFAGFYVWLFMSTGRLEADRAFVRLWTPGGVYEMAWSDIRRIEYDASHAGILFEGDQGRRLWHVGAACWWKRGRLEMLEFLRAKAELESIPMEESGRAAWSRSRRTRVKSGLLPRDTAQRTQPRIE